MYSYRSRLSRIIRYSVKFSQSQLSVRDLDQVSSNCSIMLLLGIVLFMLCLCSHRIGNLGSIGSFGISQACQVKLDAGLVSGSVKITVNHHTSALFASNLTCVFSYVAMAKFRDKVQFECLDFKLEHSCLGFHLQAPLQSCGIFFNPSQPSSMKLTQGRPSKTYTYLEMPPSSIEQSPCNMWSDASPI